jgi:hypothetical protein
VVPGHHRLFPRQTGFLNPGPAPRRNKVSGLHCRAAQRASSSCSTSMQPGARSFTVKRSIPESRPICPTGRTHRQTGPPVPALECRRARRPSGTGGAERRRTPRPTAPTTPKATATGPRPPPRRPRQRRNNATLQPTRQ